MQGEVNENVIKFKEISLLGYRLAEMVDRRSTKYRQFNLRANLEVTAGLAPIFTS